ncbi:MAG TPA: squalene/phytoene synthase family protein [Allosphingosinicella sp.]|jgi:phytoene synthase
MSPDLDPDRILALSYVPARRRAAVGALWRLDAALGAALAGGREPMMARIKLAWWREALEKLDVAPAPAEPVLKDLAAYVVPAVAGAELARMEDGWSLLIGDEALGPAELDSYAAIRGALLFRYTARLLGGEEAEEEEEGLGPSGEAWALVDLARHCAASEDSDVALEAARRRRLPARWPSRLRPLGMLAALAARDSDPARPPWEVRGSPGRMWLMLRHRIFGY